MEAAQEMDRVGHVPSGMATASLEQCGKVRMACSSAADDPSKLGRSNADRFRFY
jgi:hypothetical protein